MCVHGCMEAHASHVCVCIHVCACSACMHAFMGTMGTRMGMHHTCNACPSIIHAPSSALACSCTYTLREREGEGERGSERGGGGRETLQASLSGLGLAVLLGGEGVGPRYEEAVCCLFVC
jgi:hypothetical protein